jgi:transposase InsO family protein
MSRRPRSPRETVRRFEWPCPGDLLQMDTKRLARFSTPGHAVTGDRFRTAAERRERVGWEFCHSMIDDHSRLAFTEIHRDEQAPTVTGFVERALAFFASHGVSARRVQTDNAWADVRDRGLRELLAARAITHRTIPPRTPKRNGKVERLPANARPRMGLRTALPVWLEHYNSTRNHSSLSNRPPITRVRDQPRHNS